MDKNPFEDLPSELIKIILSISDKQEWLNFQRVNKYYYNLLSMRERFGRLKQIQIELTDKLPNKYLDKEKYYVVREFNDTRGTNTLCYCNGCSATLNFKDLAYHKNFRCQKTKPFICKYCDTPFEYFHYNNNTKFLHQTIGKICLFAIVGCDYCPKQLYQYEKQSHEMICKELERKCHFCNGQIKHKDFNEHVKKMCKERIINCYLCMKVEDFMLICSTSDRAKSLKKSYRPGYHEEYMNHYNQCQIKCKYCNYLIPNKYLLKHVRKCTERKTKCNYCGLLYRKYYEDDIEHHKTICEVTCKHCNKPKVINFDEQLKGIKCLICWKCKQEYNPHLIEHDGTWCLYRVNCAKCKKLYYPNHICKYCKCD